MSDESTETPWFKRSRWEWELRAGGGTSRVLMNRLADEHGLGSDGSPVVWQDVATFASYNDAEMVLRLLRSIAQPPLGERSADAQVIGQLTEVIILANQHGYDNAADWIGARLRERHERAG